MIDLPNGVGLPESEAEAKLKSVGLVVGTVTTASSATTPTGSVSNTKPAGCDLRLDPGWRGHRQWCGWLRGCVGYLVAVKRAILEGWDVCMVR
jgi:hypothetical protein